MPAVAPSCRTFGGQIFRGNRDVPFADNQFVVLPSGGVFSPPATAGLPACQLFENLHVRTGSSDMMTITPRPVLK